jgi:hypothetical protein
MTARTITRPHRAVRHWLQGRRPWWWPSSWQARSLTLAGGLA